MRSTVILSVALIAACTDDAGAYRALDSSGFTDIRLTGYAWYGCSNSDTFNTGFVAKNTNGKTVSGVVCCGALKSCTVRF